MNIRKVRQGACKGKPADLPDGQSGVLRTQAGKGAVVEQYDHFVAVDWSQRVMAVAHMTRWSKTATVFERAANLRELKQYLRSLQGRTVVALEETTTAQWLYLELVDHVDHIVICDPYRNRLLCDGPKTDKIDAGKLCLLLRAGLLKEVFHSTSGLYELRRLVSAYNDLVQAGVRALNQGCALEQAHGIGGKSAPFILEQLAKTIELYRTSKEQYEQEFQKLARRNRLVKNLTEVTGIGVIGAVKIVATVVDAHRFPRSGQYLSYCGLVEHEKISGGRSYGRRTPRRIQPYVESCLQTVRRGEHQRNQQPHARVLRCIVGKGDCCTQCSSCGCPLYCPSD
ncbi:MAG: transposase, partial [Bacteroidota bacterium]